MGLGATYRFTAADLHLGADLVGSPTLGPTPFMHRASARNNPQVPLIHHYLDSTHITTGVLRAGVAWGSLTLEVSVFRGAGARRESLEHRAASTRLMGRTSAVAARPLGGTSLGRTSASARVVRALGRDTIDRLDHVRRSGRVAAPGDDAGMGRESSVQRLQRQRRRVSARRRLARERLVHGVRTGGSDREGALRFGPHPKEFAHRHWFSDVRAFTLGYVRDFQSCAWPLRHRRRRHGLQHGAGYHPVLRVLSLISRVLALAAGGFGLTFTDGSPCRVTARRNSRRGYNFEDANENSASRPCVVYVRLACLFVVWTARGSERPDAALGADRSWRRRGDSRGRCSASFREQTIPASSITRTTSTHRLSARNSLSTGFAPPVAGRVEAGSHLSVLGELRVENTGAGPGLRRCTFGFAPGAHRPSTFSRTAAADFWRVHPPRLRRRQPADGLPARVSVPDLTEIRRCSGQCRRTAADARPRVAVALFGRRPLIETWRSRSQPPSAGTPASRSMRPTTCWMRRLR